MKLQEFQQTLSKALDSKQEIDLWIGVLLENQKWVLNINYFKETSAIKNISKIGLVMPHILGVSNFKGHIYGIVDMKKVIYDKMTAQTPKNIVTIMLDQYTNSFGLLWDDCYGLLDIKSLKEEKKSSEIIKKMQDSRKKDNKSTHPNGFFIKNIYVDKENQQWLEFDVEEFANSEYLNNIRVF